MADILFGKANREDVRGLQVIELVGFLKLFLASTGDVEHDGVVGAHLFNINCLDQGGDGDCCR